jgi:mannitol/fructose-specific phosphotransferase system IIA component (Ntr-type)
MAPKTKKNNPSLDPNGYPQLATLLNAHTVRAQVSADRWQDTVQAAGRLLVESGGALPCYVDAMERVIVELGPYAVLAPGIVLLHARPEDGVLQPCLVLVTLATPVRFGHSQNDPVDIVLALGAVDKKSHLQALQQLAAFLGDPQLLANLRSAREDAALLDVIQVWAEAL